MVELVAQARERERLVTPGGSGKRPADKVTNLVCQVQASFMPAGPQQKPWCTQSAETNRTVLERNSSSPSCKKLVGRRFGAQ